MLALFAEMERTFTAERAAHTRAVAEAAGRPVAHPANKIDYARLLNGQGASYGEISAKTSIPKASLHRYLADADHTTASIGNQDLVVAGGYPHRVGVVPDLAGDPRVERLGGGDLVNHSFRLSGSEIRESRRGCGPGREQRHRRAANWPAGTA